MTIQSKSQNNSHELIPWRVYGNGTREAQVLETTDAQGNKRLVGNTRPVASAEEEQDDLPVHAAEVEVTIPALAHDALQRHAGNGRVQLTSSPSLNHLTVGLRKPEKLKNGRTFSGGWQDNLPHGQGWLFDPVSKIHYIGEFDRGLMRDENGRLEHPDGWYEGRIINRDREGEGIQRGPERLPNGQPVLRAGKWHNNGLVDGFRHYPNGDWFVGKFKDLLRVGFGVLGERRACEAMVVERTAMGFFEGGNFVEGATLVTYPSHHEKPHTLTQGRWSKSGAELPGLITLTNKRGERASIQAVGHPKA